MRIRENRNLTPQALSKFVGYSSVKHYRASLNLIATHSISHPQNDTSMRFITRHNT
jgi:GDP-D-mannose dehydratase